jgi:hypothetical protein
MLRWGIGIVVAWLVGSASAAQAQLSSPFAGKPPGAVIDMSNAIAPPNSVGSFNKTTFMTLPKIGTSAGKPIDTSASVVPVPTSADEKSLLGRLADGLVDLVTFNKEKTTPQSSHWVPGLSRRNREREEKRRHALDN